MGRLLVIGGASLDRLHLPDGIYDSPGGAGLYTALAAHRCQASVTLFGPRPEPFPDSLATAATRLEDWLGPVVPLDQFPRFEIAYQGSRKRYLKADLEREASLTAAMLPEDLADYDQVHLVPMGDARTQLAMLRACRHSGVSLISAGTGTFIVEKQPDLVREIIEDSDVFFMNAREAEVIYGSIDAIKARTGAVIYVTHGADGFHVIQGDHATYVRVRLAPEVDPTGAGDSFCGATLAFLMRRDHPVMAAKKAALLAAEVIGQIGPAALLEAGSVPDLQLDTRVSVDWMQVGKVADLVRVIPEAKPFDFIGPHFPPVGHPQALAYFFAVALQQFSFWYSDGARYQQPMVATIEGQLLKGSDYIFHAFTRCLLADPGFFSPERQASLDNNRLLQVFRADDGSDPMPSLELHLELARAYGRDMLALEMTPARILEKVLASAKPLQSLIDTLDQLGGYKEDPLRKKSSLLALMLNQRPEHYLSFASDEQVAPVIDYHLMRSCLRIGLINVDDPALYKKLINRELVSSEDEWAVRLAAYRAVERIVAQSGRSMGTVDYYFFGARKRCPEMTDPECWHCEVYPICAHRKELFQPVIGTTFY